MFIIESPILPHHNAPVNYHLVGEQVELDSYRAFMCGAIILDTMRDDGYLEADPAHELLCHLMEGNDMIPAALARTFDAAAEAARDIGQEMHDDIIRAARRAWEKPISMETHNKAAAAKRWAEDEGPDGRIMRIDRNNYSAALYNGETVAFIDDDVEGLFVGEDEGIDETLEWRSVMGLTVQLPRSSDVSDATRLAQCRAFRPRVNAWADTYKVDRSGDAPKLLSETPHITVGRLGARGRFIPVVTFLDQML